MLAHELRNPLAPIRNAAHVMRLHAPNNDTLLWAIGMVERQTRHLTHLVGDLLDVSRITRNMIELHRELVTLRSLVQNVAEACRAFMTERGHEFTVELPEETLWLDADPTRLEQILDNLLHNAAKYTPRGGQVAISAGREKESPDFPHGAAVIRVRDSGIGIAPEMLRRVFEVFSQAERTLDRAEGGLGLGLTLVRRLTEMHGGKVEAHSAGLGQGSEFVVHLPLVPLGPETFEVSAHSERPDDMDAMFQGSHGHGRRVLVVDDQVDTAQSLAELLEIWGHEVRVGYDGSAAVELAKHFHPDVVLLDIGLPLMNGYEVARQLRQEQSGREMTIVAMTGYGQDEDRRRALEAGFDLHMTKPVDLDALRDVVNSASAI
jgi:CheY-like chemotaxis protein/two-component sensor histidine kinase